MLRLTKDRRAVEEIAAVAEYVAGATAAAALLQLAPDVPSPREGGGGRPAVPLLDEADAPQAAEVLAEIREWARRALGVSHIPAIWRALAHRPPYLRATWHKERLVMGAGVLDESTKVCVALAVAGFRQSAYWIAYLLAWLRITHRLDDKAVSEVAASVAHFVSFNTIAHGMRLEAQFEDMTAEDVAPGGRYDSGGG